jgi:orotidine-5'-phosphate decarboxylase
MITIKDRERLIVALDFADMQSAKNLVETLGNSVNFYKIGLELLMSGDYFVMISWLAKKNKKVFADLKLYDISETVGKAVKNLSFYSNIHFLTIHSANQNIMRNAVANKGNINILAVTVLTNLDQKDLLEMGFDPKISLKNLVIKKAKLAKECKIDGVVASGLEAAAIRQEFNNQDLGKNYIDKMIIVSPGIRLKNIEYDDQKRITDVKTAFKNDVDYIVVGRPITRAQDPCLAANEFLQQIKLSI